MSAPAVAEIRTERLTLRPIQVGDVASFAHMLADPEVVRFIFDGSMANEETAGRNEASTRRTVDLFALEP